MNDAPLLDTHAWVWWVGIAQRLGQKLVAALDALPADRRPYLSDISLWEVSMLAERGRVSLTPGRPAYRRNLSRDGPVAPDPRSAHSSIAPRPTLETRCAVSGSGPAPGTQAALTSLFE